MFLEGKNLLVLGLGKTGLAVIDRMHKVADTIIAVDDNPMADTGNIKEKGVKIVLGNDASNKEGTG
ncbi:MAG: hypothetical protein U5N58_03890 [Actinomycetota bacterium]|nr:hypothetical protein [Actinomycetota bacterium]